MYYYGYNYSTSYVIGYLLVFIGFIITVGAQVLVSSNYSKYKKIKSSNGIRGSEVARKILDENGLGHVKVVSVRGNLTDHYDPREKVVRLSNDIYNGDSIASVAVASHECGHAIQDKEGYRFLRIRSGIIPSEMALMICIQRFLISLLTALLNFQNVMQTHFQTL